MTNELVTTLIPAGPILLLLTVTMLIKSADSLGLCGMGLFTSGRQWEGGQHRWGPGKYKRPQRQRWTLTFGGTNYIYGEGNGIPLQYSCLENPMDGGAW